jgi:DNA-directed RNA polymerase specialized sigma subunit
VEKIEHRRESTYHDEWDARITEHPYRLHEHDYPEQSLLRMFEAILNKCASNGTISTSNALVARMVYIESRTLVEVAKTLGVHRSAVSQQLRRVRIAVRDAATTTDPTFLP